MFNRAKGSVCRGLKSVEDQVPTDVRDVVQTSVSDLMARGVAIDLLQLAERVGPQYEAAEYRRISGRGSRTVRLGSMVTGDGGHNVYPGSGPLYGGNTLLPA